MAVRIRLKKLGRRHRPFFRVCAMDGRTPRDGKVIEELGYYDPMVSDTDARAILDGERIAYWLSQGAQPSEKVGVLIKKYGKEGTHLDQQKAALDRIESHRKTPFVPPPPKPAPEPEAEAPAEAAPASDEAPSTDQAPPADEAAASEDAPAAEPPAAEASDSQPGGEGAEEKGGEASSE